MKSLTGDISSIQNFYIRSGLPIVLALLLIVTLCALAGFLSFFFGVTLFVLFVISSVGLGIESCVCDSSLLKKINESKRSLYTQLTDTILGLRDVVLTGRSSNHIRDIQTMWHERACVKARIDSHARLRAWLCQACMGLAVCVCVLWACATFMPSAETYLPIPGKDNPFVQAIALFAPLNEEPIPQNWIAAFALCLFPLVEFFLPVPEACLHGLFYKRAAQNVSKLMYSDTKTPLDAEQNAINSNRETDAHTSSYTLNDASSHTSPDKPWAVTVNCSSWSYSDSQTPALHAVHLQVPLGGYCVITGNSGSGKTTLAKLIAGLLPQKSATIQTQGSVGLIEQDAYIFNKTLRENLLISKSDATDEELRNALQLVGLDAFLAKLPKGLDTVLASAGENISGGEAARITVARAFLADFDVVIFDEPFRALDWHTAELVERTIRKVLAQKTILLITH